MENCLAREDSDGSPTGAWILIQFTQRMEDDTHVTSNRVKEIDQPLANIRPLMFPL